MLLLADVYAEAGFNFDDVVQSQVFITDMNDYKAMNEVYAEYFKNAPPARAAVQTVLFPGALIEIIMMCCLLQWFRLGFVCGMCH